MSIKAYKYRIYANKQTMEKLQWVLDRCRELYNAALSERKDYYQQYQQSTIIAGSQRTVAATMVASRRVQSISFYGQKRDLVELKEVLRPEYQEIASHVLQDVLLRLEKAFRAFFRRVKNGEEPGYPRFQGRARYDSFTYPNGPRWKLPANERPPDKKGMLHLNLHLTNIGTVKLHLHRDLAGTIKTLTIKRAGGHCYACFSCKIGKPKALPISYEDVGIDLGVTHF